MPAYFATSMYAFMGAPLLVILVLTLAGRKLAEKWALTVGYIVGMIQMLTSIIAIIVLWQYNKASITFSQFWSIQANDGAAYFSADVFSLIALFCIGMVTFAAFYTAKTMIGKKAFQFTNLMMVMILGMNGLALVTDLFSLYVFLEITGVSSYVLISINRDNKGLEGGFKYLIMSAIASAFILVSLALIFINTGSLRYEDISAISSSWMELSNPILILVAFVFLICGFSIKSGLVPFHGWLPDAYQSAPAPVSIMLGGIVTKMVGVYAIIRIVSNLLVESDTVVNTCFMVLALMSIIYGAVAAAGQKDFKRLLGYSSISQIGYIILGVSTGNILGYIGAIFHFFNHATFKTTLFVNSAAVEQQTGLSDITNMGGLHKQMPITGTSNIIAFLSAVGIPPLAGFWSKLFIIIAVWQTNGAIIASIALVASIFTAVYFLRIQKNIFFGPVNEKFADIKEAVKGFKLTEIALSVITIGCGLLFPVLLLLLQAQGIV